jgi:NAD(P)-dependent dehydrogenase (short-subunit alcohol dehydrogenase family)
MSNNVVITGANRGIGLAMTKIFKAQGNNVYALCRNSSKELEGLSANIVTDIDVGTEQGIKNMKKALIGIGVDILVCNAGILRDENLTDMNINTIREQFEINALAPLRIVHALQSHFNPKGKIAMITSRMGSISDNGSGGRYGYRMSKAALNAAAMSLCKDLASQDVTVGIYHPGYVKTDMVKHNGDITADESAQRIIGLISNLTIENSGVFMHSNGDVLPW